MSAGGKRKGAGRKPAAPRVAITVRADAATAARFASYRAGLNLSQSQALAALLKNKH